MPGLSLADPWTVGLAFLGLAVFAAVGALSHEHERAFSASLIYLALGVVGAVGLSAFDVRWLDPVRDAGLLEHVTELAVVIALFSTGLKVERRLRWREWSTVTRLLVIGMPVFIALAALFGAGVMGLSAGAAIVLGAALAPTDPVLAGDIGVGPPGEEDEEHEPHFGVSAEAGFNDGLAFPFVLLGIAVAADDSIASWFALDVVYAVVGGVALGAALGYAIAALIVRLRDRELLIGALDGWVGVAATLLIYGLAETAGTYGFLAVFAGGLAFRRYERDHELNARVHDGAEIVEKFGELAVILLLGSMLTLDGLGVPGWAGWGMALLVVFVLRPATVNLALLGSHLQRPGERAFLAWFGVRGVGTLFYVAVASGLGVLAADEARLITWTAVAVVIVSVVLHGITAGPLNRWLNVNVLNPR
ncbi:MAG TPA: cation:proton antiporter [Solirubrobacteraceae bacterium]|nr:cation:proton antiporter [Solirubrobacteraceae bacterium]